MRGTTLAFGLQGVEMVLNYGLHLMLAAWLSAAGYGVYAFVVATVGLLATIGQLGLHTSIMRLVASSRAQEAWGRLRGVLIVCNRLALASSVTIAVVGAVAIWLYGELLDEALRRSLQLGMALVPLTVLSGLRQKALRGLKRIAASQFPETIVIPVVMIIGVMGAAAVDDVTPVTAMAVRVVAVALAFVLGAGWLLRVLPDSVKQATAELDVRGVLAVSVPLMFAASMQVVFNKTDTLMLGYFGSMADVGVYSLALRIAMLASFARLAINMIAHPLIAEAYARGDRAQIQRIVSLSSAVATMYCLVVCTVALVAGGWLLGTFGAEFRAGLVPLLILLVAEIVENVLCLVNPLLTMTEYQNVFLRTVAVAMLVNVGLNALLIPPYGVTGAAIATTVATVFWKMATGYLVVRRLRISLMPAGAPLLGQLVRQAVSTFGARS